MSMSITWCMLLVFGAISCTCNAWYVRMRSYALMSMKETRIAVDSAHLGSLGPILFESLTKQQCHGIVIKENRMFDKASLDRTAPVSLKQVIVRQVVLKNGPQMQMRYQYARTDVFKNVDHVEFIQVVLPALLSETRFRRITVQLANGTHEHFIIKRNPNGHVLNIERYAQITKSLSSANSNQSIPAGNDQIKAYPIPVSTPFLQLLGITHQQATKAGSETKVHATMEDKFRQINHFIQILESCLNPFFTSPVSGNDSAPYNSIEVLDMGCGKAYLTFAVHYYLQQYTARMGLSVRVVTHGVEVQPQLVQQNRDIAKQLGSTFADLHFHNGTIDQAAAHLQPEDDKRCLTVMLALHACDIATDDTLYSAIMRQSDLILVAPCCQKEIRQQLDGLPAGTFKARRKREVVNVEEPDFHLKSPERVLSMTGTNLGSLTEADNNGESSVKTLLRHGLFRGRMADLITDTLRVLALESRGYKTRVVEFIDPQHTAKNTLIIGSKTEKDRKTVEKEKVAEKNQLMSLFGVKSQRLWDLLEGADE